MSTKQASEKLFLPYTTSTGFYPDPGYSSFTNGGYSFTRTRSRSGGTVPGWKQRIANHQSATSNFDATDFAFKKQIGTSVAARTYSFFYGVIWHEKNEGFYNVGTFPSAPDFSGSAYTSAHNEAVERLYDVIRSIESPAQTGEDIGEYKQTVNQIRRPMAGLLDLTSYCANNHVGLLKKARWNNIKATAKAMADLTLEYRFGLQPLLKTLADATVALENRDVMSEFFHFNVKGKGTTATSPQYGWTGSGAIQHMYQFQYITQFTVRYKGEYRIDHNVDRRSFAGSLGLTWREFIPTIWNLIPYSFLVDYVTNLGSFLSVLSVPWSNIAWCNKTVRGRQTESMADIGVRTASPPLYIITQFSPSRYDYHTTRVLRSSQTTLPLPIFQFTFPSERQLENTLALVASKLPVIGKLTDKLNRSSGGSLDREFKLASRDRDLKIPYPFHR